VKYYLTQIGLNFLREEAYEGDLSPEFRKDLEGIPPDRRKAAIETHRRNMRKAKVAGAVAQQKVRLRMSRTARERRSREPGVNEVSRFRIRKVVPKGKRVFKSTLANMPIGQSQGGSTGLY